jgi:hypothetical protein
MASAGLFAACQMDRSRQCVQHHGVTHGGLRGQPRQASQSEPSNPRLRPAGQPHVEATPLPKTMICIANFAVDAGQSVVFTVFSAVWSVKPPASG